MVRNLLQKGADISKFDGKGKGPRSEERGAELTDSKSPKESNLVQGLINGNLKQSSVAVDSGTNVNVTLFVLLQVIQSSGFIVYQGNDLSNKHVMTFTENQFRVIEYLFSLDLSEKVFELGLNNFKTGDKHRKFLIENICQMLQKKKIKYLVSDTSPVTVKFGSKVNSNTNQGIEMFMVDVITNYPVESKVFAGRYVRFQNPYRSDIEGIRIAMSDENRTNPLSDEDHDIIKKTIKRQGERLWSRHSNLNIISACSVRRQRKEGVELLYPQPCIVLYCSCKGFIPYDEPFFPKTLPSRKGNIPVDVREGYFQLGHGITSRDKNTPLRMGGSVGLQGRKTSGTVGPFVELAPNDIGFISCAHVFFDIDQLRQNQNNDIYKNKVVVQPSDNELSVTANGTTKDCGVIEKVVFRPDLPTGIDAALVKIDHRKPERGFFAYNTVEELAKAGFTTETNPVFDSGSIKENIVGKDRRCDFIKFGRTTGLTKGSFQLDGTEVSVRDLPVKTNANTSGRFVFRGMYEILSCGMPNSFFQLGDSGAGVFLIDEKEALHCIGIAIGCTDYGTTVVEPIGPVLDALFCNANHRILKQFNCESMQED